MHIDWREVIICIKMVLYIYIYISLLVNELNLFNNYLMNGFVIHHWDLFTIIILVANFVPNPSSKQDLKYVGSNIID